MGHDGNTYQVQNLVTAAIDTYNIQRLQPFYVDVQATDPLEIALKDDGQFLMKTVLNHRPDKPKRVTELEVQIEWYGHPTTWGPWKHTFANNSVIQKYLRQHKQLKKFANKNFELSDDEQDA